MNKIKIWAILIGVIAAFAVTGCDSVGSAEKGNDNALKDEMDKMPPEKQIQQLQYSPMPAAEKAKKIQEIKDKYHITDTGTAPATPAGK